MMILEKLEVRRWLWTYKRCLAKGLLLGRLPRGGEVSVSLSVSCDMRHGLLLFTKAACSFV